MARVRPLSPTDPRDRVPGRAPAVQAGCAQIRLLVRFDALGHAAVPTVLLQGETSIGKGTVARIIPDSGARGQGPFVEVKGNRTGCGCAGLHSGTQAAVWGPLI
jgi:DNA-binding NtrC family response regulator